MLLIYVCMCVYTYIFIEVLELENNNLIFTNYYVGMVGFKTKKFQ